MSSKVHNLCDVAGVHVADRAAARRRAHPAGCGRPYPEFILHNVSIKWFQEVNSPTKLST